ncbi:hypothetical protein AJ88_09260 [Mesorhizobium amorphae CCBAU 01583]|nr:hypothetical protein AJ88_09260 [Mesorhizobium amorphae CCBAU 01583]
MKVITVPGFSVTRNTSASGLVWRSSAKPSLGVMAAMRVEPRSGQKMPEFTSRKCGATISRSSCWSVVLASANTAQSPVERASLASTSIRLTMPSGPGAVETWKFSPWFQ